jgi:hypothetical protein
MAAKTATGSRDLSAELAYLTRALKAPTQREAVGGLAERARTETWSYEEFLAACLQREVSARESHGGEGRIRAARFPSRKSLEEFDFDHARGPEARHHRPSGNAGLCHRQRQCGVPRATGNRENALSDRDRDPRLPSRAPGPVRHRIAMGRSAGRRPPRWNAASRTRSPGPLPATRHRPIPTP